MKRVSLKIVGASGQGLNSIGEIVAKGLKRAGYCVFGYREYPSLIKGGHASYQLDFSNAYIESTETEVDILICLNHHGLEHNLREVKPGGIVIHDTIVWKFSPEDQAFLAERGIKVVYLPLEDILKRLKAKAILGNVLLTAFVWSALGQDKEQLKGLVGEKFAKKKALLDLNMQCIEEGFAFTDPKVGKVTVGIPKPNPVFKDHLLLTGSHAMGLGAVHAGVRLYAGYPMTPSSPLLSYVADLQNETGMVIKQAEDEITAAQIASGAMLMGTRALTATSGGGFDLMSETLSMNAMIENPTVFVLAQRPGPATGLPTWTGQGDLLLAVNTAHGEFARCVLSVSNAQDAFDLMPVAFNLAEEYQISVIVLTDKQIAEALYTLQPFDVSKAEIRRGKLVTDGRQIGQGGQKGQGKSLKELRATDRYDPSAPDGISWRWLPGAEAATYCAQGDEHSADGTVDESSGNAVAQLEKRMRKMEALKSALPEPDLWKIENGELRMENSADIDVLLVGWGSTKGTVLDVLKGMEGKEGKQGKISYLHFTYLWPLRTEKLEALAKKAKKVILIEQNYQGQLGMLIRQGCGISFADKILKYDGRPFFVDELQQQISSLLS